MAVMLGRRHEHVAAPGGGGGSTAQCHNSPCATPSTYPHLNCHSLGSCRRVSVCRLTLEQTATVGGAPPPPPRAVLEGEGGHQGSPRAVAERSQRM